MTTVLEMPETLPELGDRLASLANELRAVHMVLESHALLATAGCVDELRQEVLSYAKLLREKYA